MKAFQKRVICYLIYILMFGTRTNAQTSLLADLYKTGHIRLIEELRIDDKKLPQNTFFENPRGVAIDNLGNVYIADSSASHIKVFDKNGNFIRFIGRKGQGPGELNGPEAISITKDQIVIRDVHNERISIFNLNGEFVKSTFFNPDSRFGQFMSMKPLPDGRLVVFAELGLPQNFSGKLPEDQDEVIDIIGTDLQSTQRIYDKKIRASRWYRNPETNSFSRIRFPYHPRIFFDVSPSGIIAIGFNEKYEIEYFAPERGSIIKIDRPYDVIKLEDRDNQDYFNSFVMAVITDNIKKVLPRPPEYIVKLTEFPDRLPPYRGIIFDSENNLWVHIFMENRATNIFDVFSPKGDFISKVIVEGAPIDGNFTAKMDNCFIENALWRIERDKDGIASIVKYKIKEDNKVVR